MAPADQDELRLRAGIVWLGGAYIIDNQGAGAFGMSGRVGVQINDLLGIYAQPRGVLLIAPSLGAGMVGASAGVDLTFADSWYVGVGGGMDVMVPEGGPMPRLDVRLGGYPAAVHSEVGHWRYGLSLGAELGLSFVEDIVIVAPLASIAVEMF